MVRNLVRKRLFEGTTLLLTLQSSSQTINHPLIYTKNCMYLKCLCSTITHTYVNIRLNARLVLIWICRFYFGLLPRFVLWWIKGKQTPLSVLFYLHSCCATHKLCLIFLFVILWTNMQVLSVLDSQFTFIFKVYRSVAHLVRCCFVLFFIHSLVFVNFFCIETCMVHIVTWNKLRFGVHIRFMVIPCVNDSTIKYFAEIMSAWLWFTVYPFLLLSWEYVGIMQ